MTEQANPNAAGSGPQFALHRIYLKDASFEIPNAPAVFMQDWKPEDVLSDPDLLGFRDTFTLLTGEAPAWKDLVGKSNN